MSAPDGNTAAPKRGRDLKVALSCAAFAFGMAGLAFASVPLYDLFCRVTGYGGTTQVSAGNEGIEVLDRTVEVRFDANVAPSLSWSFAPDTPSVTLKIGAMETVFFRAKNIGTEPTVGTATFNVTPGATGAYFSKIACFCFTEQRLEPGEELEMGVTFYVDPAIIEDADTADVKSITLSYTFFKSAAQGRPVADATSRVPAREPQKPTL